MTTTETMTKTSAKTSTDGKSKRGKAARVVREVAVEGVSSVHGVTFDGSRVWFAHGDEGELVAVDAASGERERSLRVPADAGVAFDGECLWVGSGKRIRRVHPETGAILADIESPAGDSMSGLAWHAGSLWVGCYKDKLIFKVDPKTGAVKKRIASDRMVTGVTFHDGDLWHGAIERDETSVDSELRRVDVESGEVVEARPVPDAFISGTEFDGQGRVWCGDPKVGKLRLVEL
jgi:outer membrane protein assembly factor BamB